MRNYKLILNKVKFALLFVLLMGFVLSSCQIDKSINTDPNNIAESKVKSVDGVNALLVGLQVNVGETYSRDRSRIFSIWTWQMCAPPGIGRAQPVAWNNYFMNVDGPTDDYWIITYRGMKICNDIISFVPDVFVDVNAPTGNTIKAIAYTYKAFLLGEAAATWGSIPIQISGTEPPDFVEQNVAYQAVQKILDSALATINAGTASVSRDLNFAGDANKWTAVIHSLKARYYLHVGDYANALAESKLGIADATGSVYSFFSDTPGEHSSWGQWVQDEGETIRPEKYYVDLFKTEPTDTRIAAYFYPNANGQFFGYAAHASKENLYQTPIDTNELSVANCVTMKKYSTYSESFPLIRYEENVLIQAECEAKVGSPANAVSLVNIVRTNAGLPNFSSSDPTAIVTEVLKQKFLELYLEGQCYHDMRRTGTLVDPVAGSNLRFIYGQSERNANTKVPTDNDQLNKYILNTKYGGLISN